MRRIRADERTILACLLGLSIGMSGCVATGRGTAPVPSRVAALPTTCAVAESPAPTLRFRQWSLGGSYVVAANTERYALLVRNTHVRYPSASLDLLDLRNGRRTALLTTPRQSRLGYDILGYKLSDDLVVWEESSPNDLDDPEHLGWTLFASRFDPARGMVGRCVALDGSSGGRRTRPLFGVEGSTVVWMTSMPVLRGGRVTGQRDGVVAARNVFAGTRTILATSSAGFETLSLSEGRPLVRVWDARAVSNVLQVLGGGSPAVEVTLGPGTVSHFPAVHDGRVAWAVGAAGDAWPSLFLREASGKIALLGVAAFDPVFAGDRLFFESDETSGGAHHAAIWVTTPGSGLKSRLLDTDVATGGWWHLVLAQGYMPHSLVVYDDLSPWKDGTDRRTLIRVYDAGG